MVRPFCGSRIDIYPVEPMCTNHFEIQISFFFLVEEIQISYHHYPTCLSSVSTHSPQLDHLQIEQVVVVVLVVVALKLRLILRVLLTIRDMLKRIGLKGNFHMQMLRTADIRSRYN